MKYMSIWKIAPENFAAAVKRFKSGKVRTPKGVTLVGRWHAMATGEGFSLIESDDPVAVAKLASLWADLVEQRIFPVMEDDEVAKAL